MKKIEEGSLGGGIYFDGTMFFVTCEYCGHEQGDMGRAVKCEECGGGPMPSMETDGRFEWDEETETWMLDE
jgi:hypothetical protein